MSLPQRSQVVTLRSSPVTSWIALAARLLLGGVLGAAAVLKLDDSPAEQVRAVRAYQLLPQGLDALVGYTLPIAELLLAIVLVLGIATRLAAVLSGVLMIAFIAGVASAWARGLTIDCGCFGGGGEVAASETAYPQEILRDVGLLAVAAFLAFVGPGRFALSSRLRGRSGSGPKTDEKTDEETGDADRAGRAEAGSGDGEGGHGGGGTGGGGSEPTETAEHV